MQREDVIADNNRRIVDICIKLRDIAKEQTECLELLLEDDHKFDDHSNDEITQNLIDVYKRYSEHVEECLDNLDVPLEMFQWCKREGIHELVSRGGTVTKIE